MKPESVEARARQGLVGVSRACSDDSFSNGHACAPVHGDALAPFTGHGSRCVDDVSAWQTVEPAIDFDAAAALAFALLATP